MDTEMKHAVRAADEKAQYDERAKRLLGQKIILAHILVKAVDEFKGMSPKEVVPLIEGTPCIGTVPLEPGLTNQVLGKGGSRVAGINSEDGQIQEGFVRFDIVFYVRMKDGLSQIIVNVEAQKDEPDGYAVLNRAIFYVSRLVSSQKERDFEKTNYNDIKRVFSIWICMNMPENSMTYVHLTKETMLGSHEWKGNLNLLNIVLLGLSDELPEHEEAYELHRLLGVLFSKVLTVDEKLNIIETEYDIPTESEIRKDVRVMCNLSQGIEERGIIIGRMEGREEVRVEIILNMYKKGFQPEQIADIIEEEVEKVEAVIKERESMLVVG